MLSSDASLSSSSRIADRRDPSKGPTIDVGGDWAMPRTVSRVVNLFERSSTKPSKLSGRPSACGSHSYIGVIDASRGWFCCDDGQKTDGGLGAKGFSGLWANAV